MIHKEKIKKLLSDELTEEEQKELFQSEEVTHRLQSQWESTSFATKSDLTAGDNIWYRIKKNTFGKKRESRQMRFYKTYAVAASFLLLFGLCTVLYLGLSKGGNEIYIVRSGIRSIDTFTLSDGTTVNLGANSKLTYPADFKGKSREVRLEGQGFFNVQKNAENPFIVRTSQINVTVLGTEFEVFNYENNPEAEIILVNGRVSVSFPEEENSRVLSLSPNEKISYNKRKQSVKFEKVNADKYTTWRNGNVLSFENEKLSMIIPRLEKWYNYKINCPERILNHYRFTFKVGSESLERILFIMSKSAPLKYREKDDGSYEIYL